MTAHKNAQVATLWLQGHSIQYRSPTTDEWLDVPGVNDLKQDRNYLKPNPIHPEYDYMFEDNWRIKA